MNVKATEKFVDELYKIILKGSCDSKQIFYEDETTLCWKKHLKKSYMAKAAKAKPSFKAFKVRITLLLGECC